MTEVPSQGQAPPKWQPLDARQRRVLGVLIEKAKTTPAGYPMSVNAIVLGSNQKSNRDPHTSFDDFGVEKALDELRNMGAVSEVDWLGRVSKYKHHAYEWLGVSRVELAVMGELLLRGAQTLGDLRGRAARMEPIADLATLKPIVQGLIERRLMIELTPQGRGQIVSHNLYPPQELAEVRAQSAGRASAVSSSDPDEPAAPRSGPPAPERSIDEASGFRMEREDPRTAEIAELRAEVARLAERVSDLEARLATGTG